MQDNRPSTDAKGWGVIGSLPERDSDAYFQLIRTDYTFALQPDYVHYTIDMMVESPPINQTYE